MTFCSEFTVALLGNAGLDEICTMYAMLIGNCAVEVGSDDEKLNVLPLIGVPS